MPPQPFFASRLSAAALATVLALISPTTHAQTLVPKWQNSSVGATVNRGVAYNPATGNILLVKTTPAIVRLQSSDGASAGSDMDLTGVSGGTFPLGGIAVLTNGTIFACNYVSPGGAPLKIYQWDNEAAAPSLVASFDNSGFSSPTRFGAAMSVFTTATTTNLLIAGATTNALLAIYDGATWTFKELWVDSQVMTPGGTFIDYNATGFANKFRVVAKARGTGGQLYNFNPASPSPIDIRVGKTAMSGAWAFIANGITSHAYNPVTRLLASSSSTLQSATLFDYTNMIFSTTTSLTAPTERSRVHWNASAADGGQAGGTVWGPDGRLYASISASGAGVHAYDVTAFHVSGPVNTIGIVGDASATMTAVFGGSELTYSWKKGLTTLTDSTKYSGTTTPSLTISNLVAGDTDTYTVTVVGVSASTTNASAVLTVNNGPVGAKTWNGGGSDDNWSTAANWSGGALNFAGDTAFFDGSTRLSPVMNGSYDLGALTFNVGAGTFSISASSGTLTLGGNLTNNSANEQTLSLPISLSATRTVNTATGNVLATGVLSGLGGIAKAGPQTLKLRGTSANTFSGLAVDAGTVALGKTAGVNAVNGAVTVASGATLTTEVSEQISNTSVVDLQTGGGTLAIADNATETFASVALGSLAAVDLGRATNKGAVQLGANAQLILSPDSTASVGPCAVQITAASPAGTRLIVRGSGGEIRWTPTNMVNTFEKLVVDGGRLRLGHGGNSWSPQDTMLGVVPSSFMQDQICITNGLLGLNGLLPIPTVVVNANRGMTISGNATNETIANAVFPGKITGPGTLWHTGGAATAPGNLELQGLNDFSGGLKLLTGAVIVNNAAAVGSGTIAFLNNAARLAASANGIVIPNPIDLSAFVTNSFGLVNDFTLSGNVNLGDTGSDPQLNVTNAANTVTFTGQLTNTLGLVKNGAGKVVLTGNNSYGGPTTVLKGSLIANNTSGSATAAGAVTVNPEGLLGGTGNVAGSVTVDGAIAPGNSVGNLSTGDQTWNGGGRYVFEMNDAVGAAGSSPGWDKLNISGALNITANSGNKFTIDITSLAGAIPGNVANFNNAGIYFWTIASAGSISGFDATAFDLVSTSFSNQLGIAYFSITTLGNDLVLQLLQPEPPDDLVITTPGGGTFTGSANLTYTVQYTDSLNPVNWQTLTTVLTDGSGVGAFTDPGPLPVERYYRIAYP